jgi:ribonuclease BN (tRNA processing enzyme)
MALTLTVLGGSPAWPNPRQGSSGYLVEGGEACLLLDCGWGIGAELRAMDGASPLTDIVITHFHPDHWFDLVPIHYAYRYGDWGKLPHPRLHLPPGGRRALDTCASAWGSSVESFDCAFEIAEYEPEAELDAGGLVVRFAPSLHYTPSFSVEVRSGDGARIAYSGDTAPTERLVRFAAGADLFVCEASLREAVGDSDERGHMDADEAGAAAADAGVGRLLLTHVPLEVGREAVVERARKRYGGPIDVAVPGLRIDVGA